MHPHPGLSIGRLAAIAYDCTMRLYKRGPVWWARVAGQRRSTKCTDKQAATLVAQRWQREAADPAHAAADQATIASAAERFLDELRSEDVSAGTLNMYACKTGHVVRLLGDVRLARFAHADAKAFVDAREAEGAHTHTVHRELTALRRILKSAARSGEFARDPRAVLPKYAAGYVPRTRFLDCFEFVAVLDKLPPGRAAFLAFIVMTGCRLKEATSAQRADIGATSIRLRGTKTAKSARTVPIISMFRPMLLARVLADADGKGGDLFTPWVNVLRDVAKACAKAGCEPFTPNDLRRTTGTWLLQLGVPIDVVAKILGHASTVMLYRVYGQLGAEDLGRLVEARLAV